MDSKQNHKHRRRRRPVNTYLHHVEPSSLIPFCTLVLAFLITINLVDALQQQNFLLPGHNLENLRIPETQPVDSIVYQLRALDRFNEQRKFSYLMTGDTFNVDEQTGEVKLIKPLDREKQAQIIVVVSVFDSSDAKNDQPVETKRRIIPVDDVDDSWPIFAPHKSMISSNSLSPTYQVEVSELVPTNSIVLGEVYVTDADEGINAEILFECRAKSSTNSACDVFGIESRRLNAGRYSVTIRTKTPLDYERIRSYKLSIVARGKRPSPLRGVPLETEAIININLLNAQDEGPVFIDAPYSLSIHEGLKPETKILNLLVQDGDAPPKRDLGILVLQSPFSEYFQVTFTRDEGFYLETTNITIDRENPLINKAGSMFNISLLAYELDDSRLPIVTESELENAVRDPAYSKDTMRRENVTVVILDLPDSRPTFIQSSTGRPIKDNTLTFNISESILSGAPIPNLDLGVYDMDQGINSRFNLKLIDSDIGPSASNAFTLDSEMIYGKAEVVLNVQNSSLLDYEDLNFRSYKFNLVANKNLDPPLVQMLEVQLNILDANDNSPEFEREQYVLEIPEGSFPGTVVGTIRAKDKDSGVFGKIDYVLRGQGSSKFKVISSEGKIIVGDCGVPQCLDYEIQPSFSLTFEARDGGGRTKNASVIINVLDINDHAPKFNEFIYRRELISDNLSSKQTYISPQLIVRAKDGDGPTQGRNNVTFRIANTNLTGLDVDPITGLIYLSQPIELDKIISDLDSAFENTGQFNSARASSDRKIVFEAEVVAEDNGSPTLNSSAKIILTVKSNRDGAPQFKQDNYQTVVRENQPIGKPFFAVQAIDPDDKDSQLRYSLGYDLNDLISINSLNGELSFKSNVDYDDFDGLPYNITVVATDNSRPYPLKAYASVSILIQDVNDKAPKFREREYKSTLLQGSTKPGDMVLQVSAVDPDRNSNLSYSLMIDQLLVHDRNGQQFTLEDVAGLATGYLAQMNKLDRIRLVSDLKSLLYIDKRTGSIELRGEPDYSFAALISILVRVQDLNQEVLLPSGEAQQDFAKCNFFLQTHTDRNPIFAPPWSIEKRDYNITMLEELNIGTPVFSLLAKDPITNQRISLFEKVFETDPKDLFRVDRSGIVYVNRRIDYDEMDKSKRLTISVKALTNDIYFSVANLNIQVIDLNDNAPQFKSSNLTVTMSEGVTYPYEVIRVFAEDRDSGEFGQVYYSLSGYLSENFIIEPRKGIISLKKGVKLDRDTEPNHLLIVTASDCNETRVAIPGELSAVAAMNSDMSTRPGCKRSSVFINLTLSDENDNDPVFLNVNKRGELEATTAETVSVGSVISQVIATDADDGPNSQLSFEIVRGDDPVSAFLKIDPDGYISVSGSLAGLGRPSPYKVLIRASDHGTPSRHSHAALLLTIDDVVANDGVPRFIRPKLGEVINLSESAGPSTFVYQVQAVDPDEDANGKIMYKLVQSSDVFEIDPFSGIIKTQLRPGFYLDREQVSNYTLIVLAQDLGSPPKQTSQVLTIQITDVNDNDPYFEREIDDPQLVLQVDEEVPIGTLIGSIQAIDKDIGQNALIGYDIIEGNSNNLFRLDQGDIEDRFNTSVLRADSICKIYSNSRLDREVKESYTLTIKASSLTKIRHPFMHQNRDPLGGRNLFNHYNASDLTKIRVTIKLNDINDNRPTFLQQHPKSVVDGTAEVYSQLMIFKAIDPDSSSSDMHYSILDVLHYPDSKYDLFGTSNRHFQSAGVQPISMRYAFDIDPKSGILRNSISLRSYIDGYFEVYVKADSGSQSGQAPAEELVEPGLLNGAGQISPVGQTAKCMPDGAESSNKLANLSSPYSDQESCHVAVTKAIVLVTHQRETFRFVFNKTKLNDRLDEFKNKLQSALEDVMFEPALSQASTATGEDIASPPPPRAEKVFLNTFHTDFYEREDGSLDFSTLTSCSQLVKFDDRSPFTNHDDLRYHSIANGGSIVPNQVISYDEVLNLLKSLNATQSRNTNNNRKSSTLFSQYGLVNIERCLPDKTMYKMSLAERVALYFAAMIALISALLAFIVSRMRKSYEKNLKLLQRSKYQYMGQPYATLPPNMQAVTAAAMAGSRQAHHMSLSTIPGAANMVSGYTNSQMDLDHGPYDTWQL